MDLIKNQPKMLIAKAAELLGMSVHGVHKRLRAKNIICPKVGVKSYLTNEIARDLFNINFKRKRIVGQIVKGGTGKTTAIHNIACCAVTYGAKVLAIDIDPQGNLTDSNQIDAEDMPVLVDAIKDRIPIQDCIVKIFPGYDLIPSRIENVTIENVIIGGKLPHHKLFKNILESVEDNYDFIFIDCPPTIGQIVTAATLYADIVLAPLNPDKFSAKGLKILKQELSTMGKHYDRVIDYRVFLNKFSGNTILSDKAITSILSDPDISGKVLKTAVRYSQEIPNTVDSDKNLFSNLKKSTSRDDFDLLARELLDIDPLDLNFKSNTTRKEITEKVV